MKFNVFRSFALTFFLAGCSHLGPAYPGWHDSPPPGNFCRVVQDWQSGTISPQELCNRYDGAFCSHVKTAGQAICAANDKMFCTDVKTLGEGICKAGEGDYCTGIKTIAAGICAALKGSFCSSETDRAKWQSRLAKTCGWQNSAVRL